MNYPKPMLITATVLFMIATLSWVAGGLIFALALERWTGLNPYLGWFLVLGIQGLLLVLLIRLMEREIDRLKREQEAEKIVLD